VKIRRFFLAVVVMVVVLYSVILIDRRLLIVRSVTVTGNADISTAIILEHAGVEPGMSVLQLRRGKMRDNIMLIPYMRSATVRVGLKGHVVIEVSERRAKAQMAFGNEIYFIDDGGILLEKAPAPDYISLPRIIGVQIEETQVGEKLQLPSFTQLATATERKEATEQAKLLFAVATRTLTALQEAGIVELIESIDVTRPHEVTMVLRSGMTVLLGPATDLTAKAQSLAAVLPTLFAENRHLGTLDVFDADRPVWSPPETP